MLDAPSKAAARRGVVGNRERGLPRGQIVGLSADEVC
jgi:hypothetical protein